MSEISSFRSTDLPARPPSSFGQRNFEKSVSSASRSSTQINRYPFLSEAANDLSPNDLSPSDLSPNDLSPNDLSPNDQGALEQPKK